MSQNDQQEPEEGFLSERPMLSITNHLHYQQQLRPLFYEPRVLATYPMHFKLPAEMIDVPYSIAKQENTSLQASTNNIDTAQEANCSSKSDKLILVYDKFKDYSKSQDSYLHTNREVNLDNLLQYMQKDYLLLKQKSADELLQPQERLEFQAKFQCANLHSAYQHVDRPNHYYCLIQNDTNTNGYTQYFYFALKGVKKKTTYRLQIVNFTKRFSFFRQGMKPTFFSLNRQMSTGCGLFEKGTNIKYERSTCSLVQNFKQKLYTLSFDVQFEEDQDFLTVSSVVPYSYSRLIYKLKDLRNLSVEKDVFFKMQTVAYTVSNNQVPEIIICKEPPVNLQTKKSPLKRTSKKMKHSIVNRKKVIVIIARQHPGQTNSSFLMEELLYSLVGESNEKIAWLLRHYEFRIYPMVNVDGVIYGNSRCDLSGFDLNRTWRHPIKQIHPQIYQIKNRLKEIQQTSKIYYCIDMHSHSKMYNVFNFACKTDEITCRVFSELISKNSPLFHLPSCKYGLSFDKRDTFRAVMSRASHSQNVTTLQCSYYGVKRDNQVTTFNQQMFKQIGESILIALRSYLKKDVNMRTCLDQIKGKVEREVLEDKNKQEEASDSEVQKDQSSLQSKLKRLFGNQKFIDKIKKRYQQQENQLQIEEQNQNMKHIEQIGDTIEHDQINQRSNKQQSPKIGQSSRSQDQEEKPIQSQDNKNNSIPKHNLNTDLPFVKNFKQSWNRPKKVRLNPNANYNSQQIINEESPSHSNPLVFDQHEFQRQMKFLYKELRNGLRDVYLRHSKIKEKERSQHINEMKSKRLQSLKSLSINASATRNRKKIMNIKSVLPNSFRSEDNEVLLRIKSQHCEGFSEKEDSFRWRYNLNHSEMMEKSVDREMQALSNRQEIGHLPIFHKFFKLKHKHSFRQ